MENIRLSPKVSQKLLITPQLKQALCILQLPHAVLKEYLKQEVTDNPLLQSLGRENFDTKIKELLDSGNMKPRDPQSYLTKNIGISSIEQQKQESISLQEYLLHQLRMAFLNEEELSIAQELISHIDTSGYLRISLEQFTKEHNLTLNKTETILKTIQDFEPSGVGARNLQECLFIQLKNKERKSSLAYKIVQTSFKELCRKKYDLIAKKLNRSINEVKVAINEIISLNPRPGTAISKEEQTIAVKPDIFVRIHKNKLQIVFNDKDLPSLKINPVYKKLFSDPDTPEETKEFIKERLKSALWLIKTVEERQKNISEVISVIIKIQKQALCKNFFYLKPLTLKDVATQTNLHLSTVGRIVSNKYIAAPQGTIKLKDLFSLKLKSKNSKFISTKSILLRIQNIVTQENKEKPLTDGAITELLRKDSIEISRRAVTKYRNKLKILPSFLRKTSDFTF